MSKYLLNRWFLKFSYYTYYFVSYFIEIIGRSFLLLFILIKPCTSLNGTTYYFLNSVNAPVENQYILTVIQITNKSQLLERFLRM